MSGREFSLTGEILGASRTVLAMSDASPGFGCSYRQGSRVHYGLSWP